MPLVVVVLSWMGGESGLGMRSGVPLTLVERLDQVRVRARHQVMRVDPILHTYGHHLLVILFVRSQKFPGKKILT